MSYDNWKLRSPDDDLPEEECFHEEYESNWEGRATCGRCGHSWWLTSEEIAAERANAEAYDAYCQREEWRQWREDWRRHRFAFWRRWRKPTPVDDEIPF